MFGAHLSTLVEALIKCGDSLTLPPTANQKELSAMHERTIILRNHFLTDPQFSRLQQEIL